MKYICFLAVAILSFGCAKSTDDKSYEDRMAKEHANDQPVQGAAMEPSVPVTGERVVYATVDGVQISGYLARPKSATGPLPALITIHEWWGLNEYVEMATRRLAGEGYLALAIDLYGGEKGSKPEEAKALMQKAMKNMAAGKSNVMQAFDYLKQEQKAPKVGVIGWCFGGAWTFNTAVFLPEKISAAVIYYGRTSNDAAKIKPLQMPIQGHFGAEDKGIPVEGVRKFEAALKAANKQADIYVYEGANHAFANPSGTRYNAVAAAKAWERTTAFFAKHLK